MSSRRRASNPHATRRRVFARRNVSLLRLDRRKTFSETAADYLTGSFGTVAFLFFNISVFTSWIVWNLGWIRGLEPFDPFPFGLLTMIVSLESIILSVIVLMSQNRAAKIGDAREEIDFEVGVESEKQIAAIMRSLDLILHRLEIHHTENKKAMQELNVDKLQRRVIREIDTD